MDVQAQSGRTDALSAIQKLRPRALIPSASAHMDLIRGLAAWGVMWGHVRALFFVDFPQLQHAGFILKTAYFFTGFGHEAVMVFFVLSGFLISSTIIGRRISGGWSWRDYAIDRVCRLYVVLIPGLVLGLFWDTVGGHIFSFSGTYSRPLPAFGAAIAQNQLTARIFLGNLFFLQTIVCPTFGSNGPLWSLANEFWYYVLFPVALAAGIQWARESVRWAIPFSILAICVAFFVGRDILLGFLVWLAGTALVFAYSNFRFSGKNWLSLYAFVSSLALSVCLVAARTRRWPLLGSDIAIGVAFSRVLLAVLQIEMGANNRYYTRLAHFLAGFSYSLYVLHFPFLLFLRSWLVPAQKWQPDAIHVFYAVIIGGAVLGFAWLVSTFTESKTRVVRNWLKNVMPVFDVQSP